MKVFAGMIWSASLMLTILLSSAAVADSSSDHWQRWRGPNADGVAEAADPPVEWSETENVKWKIEIPGKGSSTPVIWEDRIYVATAVKTDRQAAEAAANGDSTEAEEQLEAAGGRRSRRGRRSGPAPTNYYQFVLFCYDRETGKENWREIAAEQVPHEAGHGTNTFASASPVTNGEEVFVSFGSRGVYCFNRDGQKKWEKQLGQMETRSQFGEGASPALHDDVLIVPWDHEGESFVFALDASTGDVKWKTPRDERTTWATPLVVTHEGRTQVILNGSRVRSYDLATGALIWECGGQASNPIPTPVLYDDAVICMTGFRGNAVYSIALDATGDVTESDAVRWHRTDAAPYVPSPALYKGQLYFSKGTSGVVTALDAETGDVVIAPQRLKGIENIYASPIAAADRVYFTGRDGSTTVIEHGDKLKILATNKLDEAIDASPVIAGDELYLRGEKHLYCISNGE